MNPIVNLITSFLISINRLLDSLTLQTIQNIKRGFYFIIFLMCIIGVIIGINMGKKAAKIKSPPFAEYVNDTFRIDLNRERDAADFSELLEKEVVNQSTINNFDKAVFPTKENMNPQYSDEPVGVKGKISEPDIVSTPYKDDSPVDEDLNRKVTGDDAILKPIERNLDESPKNIIIRNDSLKSEDKKEVIDKTPTRAGEVKTIEKNKTVTPRVIFKEQGVIGQ